MLKNVYIPGFSVKQNKNPMSLLQKWLSKSILVSLCTGLALTPVVAFTEVPSASFLVSTGFSMSGAAAKDNRKSFISSEASVKTIKTEHFTIRHAQEDEKSARFLARESEPSYKRLLNYLGIDPEINILLYLAPDEATFRLLQPKGPESPGWAMGLAYPKRNLILIKSPRLLPGSRVRLKETLLHELTHIMVEKIIGPDRNLPRWLNEGLAMYIAGEWGAQDTINLTRISLLDSFVPLDTLIYSFPADENEARQAYTQSFSFVSYLRKTYGREGLHRLIWAFSKTNYPEMAFQLAFSTSLPELEKDWRSYVRVRYTWIPTLISGTTIWFLMGWLFIAGYISKRRRSKKLLQQWDEEEAQEY